MMKGDVDLQSAYMLMDICTAIGKETLINPNVQKLLSDRSQEFDLIITEWLYHDLYAG